MPDPSIIQTSSSIAAAASNGSAGAPGSSARALAIEANAWRHLASHVRLWLVTAAGLVFDLWSKEWAFHSLRQDGRQVLIPRVLEFRTMLNPGALFGLGHGRTTLFLLASLLGIGLVLWMFAHASRRRWLVHVALGAILAGALGNMYDRAFVQLVALRVGGGVRYFEKVRDDAVGVLLREYPGRPDAPTRLVPDAQRSELAPAIGYVRDFIKINTSVRGRELWPWVFNVADILLVGGVATLAAFMWVDRRPRRRTLFPVDAPARSP